MRPPYTDEYKISLLPGYVVRIKGRLRVVCYAFGPLVATGHGRGRRKYWDYDDVEELVAKNLKLKAGVIFDGLTAERIETLRSSYSANDSCTIQSHAIR